MFEASVLLAEGASQKPVQAGAKEHAACDDRAIRSDPEPHMEQEGSAFKVGVRAAPDTTTNILSESPRFSMLAYAGNLASLRNLPKK